MLTAQSANSPASCWSPSNGRPMGICGDCFAFPLAPHVKWTANHVRPLARTLTLADVSRRSRTSFKNRLSFRKTPAGGLTRNRSHGEKVFRLQCRWNIHATTSSSMYCDGLAASLSSIRFLGLTRSSGGFRLKSALRLLHCLILASHYWRITSDFSDGTSSSTHLF